MTKKLLLSFLVIVCGFYVAVLIANFGQPPLRYPAGGRDTEAVFWDGRFQAVWIVGTRALWDSEKRCSTLKPLWQWQRDGVLLRAFGYSYPEKKPKFTYLVIDLPTAKITRWYNLDDIPEEHVELFRKWREEW